MVGVEYGLQAFDSALTDLASPNISHSMVALDNPRLTLLSLRVRADAAGSSSSATRVLDMVDMTDPAVTALAAWILSRQTTLQTRVGVTLGDTLWQVLPETIDGSVDACVCPQCPLLSTAQPPLLMAKLHPPTEGSSWAICGH